MTALKIMLLRIFIPKTSIAYLALYFFTCIIVVCGGLALYWLLRKVFPHFTAVITGGRI